MLGKDLLMQRMRQCLEKFLDLVDNNSSPNGQKEDSHGVTYYFNPKFSIIQTPYRDDPQHEFKCNHSVFYKFNCTLEEEGMGKVSLGMFHFLLKEHRFYVGICHSQSDYCDQARNTLRNLPELGRLQTDSSRVNTPQQSLSMSKQRRWVTTEHSFKNTRRKPKLD